MAWNTKRYNENADKMLKALEEIRSEKPWTCSEDYSIQLARERDVLFSLALLGCERVAKKAWAEKIQECLMLGRRRTAQATAALQSPEIPVEPDQGAQGGQGV